MTDTDTSPTNREATKGRRRKRIILMVSLAVLFVVIGAGYGAWWLIAGRYSVSTDDAYVQGNRITLMAQTQGIVSAINVDGTDFVDGGQVLVALDRADAEVALEQARAALATAVRQVRSLHQQAAEQQAVIDGQKAVVTQAESDFRRNRDLVARKTISQQVFQDSQTALQQAQAQLAQAEHQLEVLRISMGTTDVAHHPDVLQAVAAMRAAWLGLERTGIRAPGAGFVANRQVQIGQSVAPGTPLLAVVPLDQVWVEANYKETELADMRIGQPASVTADFYGSAVTYHGVVDGISAGTGAVFGLLPPQNATGNWIKVVQRVPVRISLDAADLEKHPLRLGLSLMVKVDVRDRSGQALAGTAASGPRYQTAIYREQDDGFAAAAAQIIAENGGNDDPAAAPSAQAGQPELAENGR